jgi:SAM-dependent methyltransferase
MTDRAPWWRTTHTVGCWAAILRGLAATGKPTDRIDSDDRAAGDEFHLGGREATSALFDQLGWQSEMQVLDLGCGIGGPARYLARHRDAPVIGVDLTPEFIEVAREPTRRCGLAETVEFQVCSGLELPIRTVASMQPACCMSGRTSRKVTAVRRGTAGGSTTGSPSMT